MDRLRRDGGGGGAGGVDDSALSEKLESVNSSLKGELEECRNENEELRAEPDLLRIKVRRLERSTAETSERDDSETPRPSSRLDASARAFTPTVRFSLPEETTSPTLTETRPSAMAMESFATPSLPVRSGVTLPAGTAVSSVSTSAMDMPISTPSLATATVPAATVTGSHLSVPDQLLAAIPSPSLAVSQAVPAATVTGSHLSVPNQIVAAIPPPSLAVSQAVPAATVTGSHLSVPNQIVAAIPTPSLAVSQAGRGTTPSMIPVASSTPTLTTGTGLPYPVVHPSHLPQILNFHGGDQRDGETFEDWLDHFEAVSNIAKWDPSFRLVHLSAALRGNARSFYRSCTPVQKSSYPLLVGALKKRFTPVKLTALQTQMFHSRKQGPTESVDDFAQELRKLHSKAYSATTGGNAEAEKVGQIVLVNQFLSGLRSELQSKVVGVEGSMEEIVAKARFEEAKRKELSSRNAGLQLKKNFPPRGGQANRPSQVTNPPASSPQPKPGDAGQQHGDRRGKSVTCYKCGMEGHVRSRCPYPRQQEGTESQGRPQVKNISHETPETPLTQNQMEIRELRERLRRVELAEAIENARAMNLVVPVEAEPRLGPTVYAPIAIDGVTTNALVDTGSPATIVSLEFALKVLRRTRPEGQTESQWVALTQ